VKQQVAALRPGQPAGGSHTGNDERVTGILTTGWKPIFPQCDNKLQKHRECLASALTALQFYARAKDGEPIYAANCGPIIGKAFYSGKRSVMTYFL
jgi:hypothetical protein